MKYSKHLTLGIESSCDETAASVVADGRDILSDVIASQVDIHKLYGGVVPEIASREHLLTINSVIDTALANADVSIDMIDSIGVTMGPGLVGAVLVGVSAAKAFAYAAGIPLVGVHHIKGHIYANLLTYKELNPPFLSLVISGGHTELVDVRSVTDMRVLGRTRDDAVGEAYDKVARVLGLGYPGGPALEKAARNGDPDKVFLKRVMLEEGSLDFSLSGTKTGVLNYINSERQAGRAININDVAAGFQAAVSDVISAKTDIALKETAYKTLVLGGGVAANSFIKEALSKVCEANEAALYAPPPGLCTDNAAMIACAAYYLYKEGCSSPLSLDAAAVLAL